MAKKKEEQHMALCPVGRFFQDLERASGRGSEFFEHLNRSRMEFLKAVRSLVEERIEDLEKRDSKKRKKKATKIRVE